jgi:hypothetical protein
MKKQEYIRAMLRDNINVAEKTIKELYDEIKELNQLPNDCSGIMIDDMICENPNYKIDLLTHNYHVIGYMESMRALSNEMLMLESMNSEEFEDYLLEQAEIEKHNQEEMERVRKYIENNRKE